MSADPIIATPDRVEAGRRANQRARRENPESKPLTPGQIKWRKQKAKADADAVRFKLMCEAAGLPLPIREYRFAAPERDWRADFGWEPEKVLLEVEGGAWSGGRHTRGSGYLQDMEKYNAAVVRGFKLLRCTPKDLCTETTIRLVQQALAPTEP